MNSLANQISELYSQQVKSWPDFGQAILSLKSVVSKQLVIGGDNVIAQFNPARIRSTAAKVDSGSIQKRACFLCQDNRPELQLKVQLGELEYTFLVNPFPVLEMHFTVVHNLHILQELESHLESYFKILLYLGSDWALVYNGSKAGASAPDHLHYQIVPAQALPLYAALQGSRNLTVAPKQLFRFSNMSFILLQADSLEQIIDLLSQCFANYSQRELLNVVSWISNNRFYCFFMPRAKHRPDCYYFEEDKKLLISPGAMELSGVWVLPREQDFAAVSAEIIAGIAAEVTLTEAEVAAI